MSRLARRSSFLLAVLAGGLGITLAAQAPQPFPRAAQPPPPVAPRPGATAPAAAAPATDGRPTEAELGVPVYPTAVYLRSYDAGRGQKYHIFGAATPFAEMVTYYRNVLKDKGNLVFEVPPTHVFEIGKFKDETMAFPPTVTIKDYTFSGSGGYPNPKAGAAPERFPTLIQIVPAPAGTAQIR